MVHDSVYNIILLLFFAPYGGAGAGKYNGRNILYYSQNVGRRQPLMGEVRWG